MLYSRVSDLRVNWSRIIVFLRKHLNLTGAGLSAEIEKRTGKLITRQTIYKWETGIHTPRKATVDLINDCFACELRVFQKSPDVIKSYILDFEAASRVGDPFAQFESLQHLSVVVGTLLYQMLGDFFAVETKAIFGGDLKARVLLADRNLYTRYVLELTGDPYSNLLYIELGQVTNKDTHEAVSMLRGELNVNGLLSIIEKLKSLTRGR